MTAPPPLNRAQRRAQEAAARRNREIARGTRTLRLVTLDGQELGAMSFPPHETPADQIRTVNLTEVHAAGLTGVTSVTDLDRIGRVDLVRTFMLDRSVHPPCYREVPGGHDRIPAEPVSSEFGFDFRAYPGLLEARNTVFESYPPGEILLLEALLLAFLVGHLQPGDLDAERRPATTARLHGAMHDMLQRTGQLKHHGPERVARAVARLPELHRRYRELAALRAGGGADG